MDYFQFYDLPVSFLLDESALKDRFYAYSRKYHPDFYTLESEEKQDEILELSTLNTNAYKTLSDFDHRMKYILELKGVMEEEGKASVPQDFLMEMMEINEQLMELEFDFDQNNYEHVLSQVNRFEKELLESVTGILENYDDSKTTEVELNLVKDYYHKKRYLLRIKENLDKFGREGQK